MFNNLGLMTPRASNQPPPDADASPPPDPEDTQASSGGSTRSTVLKPIKPTMGDVLQVSTVEYTAWTGGQPNADWTGLDPTAATVSESPNQNFVRYRHMRVRRDTRLVKQVSRTSSPRVLIYRTFRSASLSTWKTLDWTRLGTYRIPSNH